MAGHQNLLAKEADAAEVFELHYYTGFTIFNGAGTLAKTLVAIRKATGHKTVTIVAHSMGGLVARTYTQSKDYAGDVHRLVTLGTPHGGTNDAIKWASLPLNALLAEAFASALEMAPGSLFLTTLNAKPLVDLAGPAPDYHVLMGAMDQLVAPKYAPLAKAVGLVSKPHPNVVEYCFFDKYHTSIGTGANSGIADMDGTSLPTYAPVCRAIGLTSACGGKATFDDALCNCKPTPKPSGVCTPTELPTAVCHGPLSQPPKAEVCDNVDNDCNGQTDELPAAQLQTDPANCGQCGKSCLGGQICAQGKCGIGAFGDPTDKQTTKVNVTVTQVEQAQGGKVKVYASVQTQSGDPVEQLTTGNFGVEETANGVSVSTTVESLEVAEESTNGLRAALVIDSSGSMYTEPPPSALELAKAAAKEFVSYLKPGDEVAIVDFSSDVIVQQGLTNNKLALFSAIDKCDQQGGTAMFDGALTGVQLLNGLSGQRAVLVLTDGGDTASTCGTSATCIAKVVTAAKGAAVPIYTIGLGLDAGSQGESDLLALATQSNAGGKGIGFYPAPGPNQLKALYEKVATILKKTYVVGWYTSAKAGQQVTAKVTVKYQSAAGQLSDTFVVQFVAK